MSQHIHTWLDGLSALRERALVTRGHDELEDGVRWPRTIGIDVIAIAALFDPAIKQHATPGVLRRWHATRLDLERDALEAEDATYPGNRAFWATLESAAVFLDDVSAPSPVPAVWDALIAEIGRVPQRNLGPKGDGPFRHFDNVKTFLDLYQAQWKFLIEKRGADELDPEPIDEASYGTGGIQRRIPRTINSDVVALASYWSEQLDDVKEVFGREGVQKRWRLALADVMSGALYANPTAVYPKNNKFWRALLDTVVHIAGADKAPSKFEMAIESIKDSARHLPETLGKAVSTTASGAGALASNVAKGFLSNFTTPLIVAGAGVIGLLLLTRGRSGEGG